MALPSITDVARYWSNRCLRCDALDYTCVTCWGSAVPGENQWPYGPGDIRFKGRLLLMFGGEPTVANTAPFCPRCWRYLKPRAVTLDWLCQFRDRKALAFQPDTLNEWVPVKVRTFYETQIGSPEHELAVLKDPVRRAERERVVDLAIEAYHTWLRQEYREVPARSRYISDPVKEEVFKRDDGQCVKCREA